jgi:drug/metabolite transporter (DMT)-like permease
MLQAVSSKSQATIVGVLAVLTAAAFWALTGIFVKKIMAVTPISSLSLAFWRDSVAFFLFLPATICFERDRLKVSRADWPVIGGMGVSLGIFHMILNLGFHLNGAAITIIQQTAMPAIVLIVARFIWKESLTRLKILSVILIAIGAVLVSGVFRLGTPDVTLVGVGVGFLVPALYAAWTLFGKALRSGNSAMTTLTWAFGIAGLVLLPFHLASGSFLPPSISIASLWWFAGLTIVCTFISFILYTISLGRLPAGMVSILVMSEMAYAVIFAWIFLGEILDWVEISGAFVVIGCIMILWLPGFKPTLK